MKTEKVTLFFRWSSFGFLFVFLLSSLVPHTAVAETIAAVGTNLIYERGADGRAYESRIPFSLRGGYRFALADIYLEYSAFHASDGTPMISISRTHEEWLLWARHFFMTDVIVSPFVAAAAGFFQEQVQTDFATDSSKDVAGIETMAAVAIGARCAVTRQFELALEGRASAAPSFQHSPVLGLGVSAGVAF